MVTASRDEEVEAIYRRMAAIRREPHSDLSESVARAEAVMDWGRYTWTYPWIVLGAAAMGAAVAARGVRNRRDPGTSTEPGGLPDPAEPRERVVEAGVAGGEKTAGLRGALLAAGGALLPVALRAGQILLMHWLEERYAMPGADRIRPPASAGPRRGPTGRTLS